MKGEPVNKQTSKTADYYFDISLKSAPEWRFNSFHATRLSTPPENTKTSGFL